MIDRNTIVNLLKNYLFRVIEEVKKIEMGKFQEVDFERIEVQNFTVKPFHIHFNYDFANIAKYKDVEWVSSADLGGWLMNVLYKTEEALAFRDYVKTLNEALNEQIIIPYTLGEFSKRLSLHFLNGNLTDYEVEKLISTLIEDIELETSGTTHERRWLAKLEIANIHLESPEFKVSNGYSLKQFSADDFTLVRPAQHIPELDRITSRSSDVTTQLVLRIKARRTSPLGFYPEKINAQFNAELNVIRLFRVCSIYPVAEQVIPLSLIEHGSNSYKEIPFETYSSGKVLPVDKGEFRLLLVPSDFEKFMGFREKMLPIITQIDSDKYFYGNYLEIAFHRYLDSLLRSDVYAYRILSAISCLEALFTMHETEVTFKLKSRLGLLLSCVGLDAKIVSKAITEAYDLRSKIVHGGELKSKHLEFARNSCFQILDYARISMIIFWQFGNKSKSDIIDLLNNSLIDKKDYETLNATIQNMVIV